MKLTRSKLALIILSGSLLIAAYQIREQMGESDSIKRFVEHCELNPDLKSTATTIPENDISNGIILTISKNGKPRATEDYPQRLQYTLLADKKIRLILIPDNTETDKSQQKIRYLKYSITETAECRDRDVLQELNTPMRIRKCLKNERVEMASNLPRYTDDLSYLDFGNYGFGAVKTLSRDGIPVRRLSSIGFSNKRFYQETNPLYPCHHFKQNTISSWPYIITKPLHPNG